MSIEITSMHEPRRLPQFKGAATRLREHARRAQTRARIVRVCCGALIAVALFSFAIVTYFYLHYAAVVDERLASGYLTSRSGIYAAPRVLRAGQRLSRERLVEILRRAGYVDAAASRVWSGRFKTVDGAMEIFPRRGGESADAGMYEVVRVEFDRAARISAIKGDGAALDAYTLEPEALTNDARVKTDAHETLAYSDLPPVLVRAILSIEDRRFFEHGGLDPIGIARAAFGWGDINQDQKQGGSTITQQLVKNTYLTPERTLRRKFHEAIIARVIERRMSKEDILALYCNELYLGQRGSVGVRGVQQAARVFFGKELKDISLAEAATIAGMIQSPGRYAPDRHADRARARRNTVLGAMLRDEAITRAEAEAAMREEIAVVPAPTTDATAPYFLDYVNRVVAERRPVSDDVAEGHARVYTTIDTELQQLAEESVRGELERLYKVFKGRKQPQAALVALDTKTGHVLAMVGGGSYAESQLNRATDARRQPGSVFKPIVYAAAIEGGISPVSMALDAPREFVYDRRAKYRPSNYGGGYSNHEVTLRTALVRSLNVVTVDVAMRAGLNRVASLASRLGLPVPEAYPALALGSNEATPLEVAGAYTAFANQGRVARPTVIARIDDGGAHRPMLDAQTPIAPQVLKPSTAYMLTDMLTEVINRGTARAARGAVKRTAIAGKTGTSRDGWFAGYTPNLVCVVWVGFDDGSELNLTGADSALPVWTNFVKGAVELRPELGGASFERPDSVTFVEIDPETGLLASASCPQRERVAVAPGLAPGQECFTHAVLPDALASLEMMDESPELPPSTMTRSETTPVVSDDATALKARTFTTTPMTARASNAATIEPRATRKTRIEVNRGGRAQLTNEVMIVADGASGGPQR
jgi:penicillin-binding protein 1B